MIDILGLTLLIFLSSFALPTTSAPLPHANPLENANLFLGDIVLNRTAPDTGPFLFRNGLRHDDQLWSYAKVPIEIDPYLAESAQDVIISAFEEYHQKTCVRFVPRTTEKDYIRFIYEDGCYSSLGRIGGMQTVSLGNGCHCKGTVIHELMHALGFYHEHSRSDRDEYVEIVTENIADNLMPMFTKLKPWENRLLSDYDYDSITHYDGKAFSKEHSLVTMIPKQENVALKHPCEKNVLSTLDVKKLKKLYQCES